MLDQVQTALTLAFEVIALIALFGLPAHAIAMHHINTVRSWGIPQAMPIVEPVFEVEPVVEAAPKVVEVEQALEQALERLGHYLLENRFHRWSQRSIAR